MSHCYLIQHAIYKGASSTEARGIPEKGKTKEETNYILLYRVGWFNQEMFIFTFSPVYTFTDESLKVYT